jgi:hypothetical protein
MHDRRRPRANQRRVAAGYKAVYQRTAVVHTLAPDSYPQLCKMLLRWDRSYIREEIRLWKIMWRLPFPALVLVMLETTITNLRYPVAYGSLLLVVYLTVQDPWTIVRLLLSIGLISICYTLYFFTANARESFFMVCRMPICICSASCGSSRMRSPLSAAGPGWRANRATHMSGLRFRMIASR